MNRIAYTCWATALLAGLVACGGGGDGRLGVDSWDHLPVSRPSAVPVTADDFGTFDQRGRRPTTGGQPIDRWSSDWSSAALIETAVVVAETVVYRQALRVSTKHAFIFSLTANALSFAVGLAVYWLL